MSRTSPLFQILVLLGLIAVMGGVGLAKGGLYISLHEGDTIHMVAIVTRMLEGQVPHLDFSTPIGVVAFLPVVWMSETGLGIGQAFIAAQVLVALALLPVVVRVCRSRLSGGTAWGFAVLTLAMVLALVHGQEKLAISVSMYYNRWAWGMAFCAIILAVVEPREGRESPVFDGLFMGLLFAAMAMSKPTYFVAFFPVAVIALLTRTAFRELLVMLVMGVAVAALLVLIYGIDFFPAYIGDLLSVVRSETRSAPSASLMEVVNGPRFLVITLSAIFAIMVLRQAAQERAGLLMLLLLPGFVYVTYQNFGNDPKWLILFAVLMLVYLPERGRRVLFNWEARNVVVGFTMVAFALIMPSIQNMITSPFRHLSEDVSDYAVYLDGHPKAQDIFTVNQRTSVAMVKRVLADDMPAITTYEAADAAPEATTFMGEKLPRCARYSGDSAMDHYIADRLKSTPMNFPAQTRFFVADVVSMVWMVGGFQPLEGGAPWYYSGTPGAENADAIIVPLCPFAEEHRDVALKALEGAGLELGQPIRDEVFWVYPVEGKGN